MLDYTSRPKLIPLRRGNSVPTDEACLIEAISWFESPGANPKMLDYTYVQHPTLATRMTGQSAWDMLTHVDFDDGVLYVHGPNGNVLLTSGPETQGPKGEGFDIYSKEPHKISVEGKGWVRFTPVTEETWNHLLEKNARTYQGEKAQYNFGLTEDEQALVAVSGLKFTDGIVTSTEAEMGTLIEVFGVGANSSHSGPGPSDHLVEDQPRSTQPNHPNQP